MERIAIFPGSFDPFTIGHDNIVKRALSLFDKIIIAIGINEAKKSIFSEEERINKIKRIYKGMAQIEVESYKCLTIDFAKEKGAQFILRGLRSVKDFEYERDIADLNRSESGIETIFLFTEPQYAWVSSSKIRELISFGKDVSKYLPSEAALNQ